MPPRPLQQGQLDGLCALYALVNAITVTTAGLGDVAPRPRPLFRHLARELDARGLLLTALTIGLDIDQLLPLLDPCREWAAYWWGIDLLFECPFPHGATPAKLLGRLRMELSRPHTAAIIAMAGTLNHWTCIRAIERRRLWLQDSDGLAYFREATFQRPPRDDAAGRWPVADSLIVVQAQ